jgi:hypothetical protein
MICVHAEISLTVPEHPQHERNQPVRALAKNVLAEVIRRQRVFASCAGSRRTGALVSKRSSARLRSPPESSSISRSIPRGWRRMTDAGAAAGPPRFRPVAIAVRVGAAGLRHLMFPGTRAGRGIVVGMLGTLRK